MCYLKNKYMLSNHPYIHVESCHKFVISFEKINCRPSISSYIYPLILVISSPIPLSIKEIHAIKKKNM